MKIVGISACPAGLAHTPMAAKALEKAGAKLGYEVKIEQQGSLGPGSAFACGIAKPSCKPVEYCASRSMNAAHVSAALVTIPDS